MIKAARRRRREQLERRARRAGAGRGAGRRHAAVDRRPRGARHPLTPLWSGSATCSSAMGWEVAEGPEVEPEWSNFDALNIGAGPPGPRPDGHVLRRPARARGLVLRTHTSPVQARTMLDRDAADLRDLPGPGLPHRRAGRHPHPGLPPGRGPGGRQGHHDGPPARAPSTTSPGPCSARTRAPGCARRYFPFTEPSAEPDVLCFVCDGKDRPAAPAGHGWIEWGGCGMVNPRCCAPAASTRRSTPASPSAWASSAP